MDENMASMSFVVVGQESEVVTAAAVASKCESCSISLSGSFTPSDNITNVPLLGPGVLIQPYLDCLPVCRSRAEALGTTLVYVLHVNPSQGQDTFQEQLTKYSYVLDELRCQDRRLRPSRAVVLVRTESHDSSFESQDGMDFYEGSWQDELEEFELVQGNIWKFGAVSGNDVSGICDILETIALARRNRCEVSSGYDSEGSNVSGPSPLWEAEREGDVFEPDEPAAKPNRILRGRVSL